MNFLNRFRRLQWKLTLSYTLVSGSLFVSSVLVTLAGLAYFINNNGITDLVHNAMLEAVPQQTIAYFETTPPDTVGLEQWLDGVLANDTLSIPSQTGSQLSFNHTRYIAALSVDGKLLAIEPANAKDEFEQDTAVSTILPNAYAGAADPQQLRQSDKNSSMVFWAIPIHAHSSDTLQGVIFIKLANPADATRFEAPVFQDVTLMILAVLLTAFGVAAISSYFAARGLTKRLRVLADATNAWAKGDFSATIQENSQDEIGQLARQLNRMAEQLQNLLHTRSDLAALEERNRLARDLHDSVKQQIFAATMQLGAAKTLIDQEPQTAKTHLVEGDALTRQAQLELTGLIHELRPVNLREKRFVEAVQEYITDWAARTKIHTSFQADTAVSVPMDTGQELFRVLQEALANIARHSQAQTAVVTVSQQDNSLTLTIQDDGQGFDPLVEIQGVGLASMKERMEGVDGRFHIQSQPGKGTTLTAEAPNYD